MMSSDHRVILHGLSKNSCYLLYTALKCSKEEASSIFLIVSNENAIGNTRVSYPWQNYKHP